MKQIKFLFLMSLFVVSNSYGFCVYNHATGYDTLDSSHFFNRPTHEPTAFEFSSNGKFDSNYRVAQGQQKCDISGPRGQNDQSEIKVFYISEYRSPHSIEEKLICNLNVFNKGGYVEVYGNVATGFSCIALRDKD